MLSNMDRKVSLDIHSKDNAADEHATFDRALSLTGYGRFQYRLISACAICLLSAGFQNGLSAYLLPSAQCELQLSSAQMGVINVAFLIGGCLSSFLWGILADTSFGRRNLLIITLLVDGILTLASSYLATSFPILLVFRMLNGFVIGAPGTLVFSYIGEFHTEKTRTKCICYVGFFFTLSWMLLPALAWVIIPLDVNWNIGFFDNFIFKSWRLYVAILGIFPLIGSIALCFLPPSPKLILAQGNPNKALDILQKMWAQNTRKSKSSFPVKVIICEEYAKHNGMLDNGNGIDVSGKTARIFKDVLIQIKTLLHPPLLPYTSLTTFMLFANMFGYYGLGLWLPELFKRFDTHAKLFPNETITVSELTRLDLPNLEAALPRAEALTAPRIPPNITRAFPEPKTVTQHGNIVHLNSCENQMQTGVFINTFIIGIVCLLGNIGSGIIAGRCRSRRLLPIATAMIGGVATASIYWLQSARQNLIVASIFQAAMATGNMVLNGVIVDIFPTKVSALAVCTATFAGRVGAIISNLVFGLLLDISCEIPIFLVATIVLAGGVMGFLIPERSTTNPANNRIDECELSNKKDKSISAVCTHYI